MASASLLQSTASSFYGQHAVVPAKGAAHFVSVWTPSPRFGNGGLVVRAEVGPVLVDKSEADKVKRFKANYLEKIVPLLQEEFAYTNVHQIPKIEKVVVNSGIGDASQNAKGLDAAINELALITGQRPVKTRAKKSIATFKLREGMPIGIAVTLRGNIMYSFLDRLINLALPRVRDFQGVNPNSFDGHGNYSLGLSEQSVFPDVPIESITKKRGFDVCITTTANNDKEAFKLLALMGMPFREGTEQASPVRKKKLKAHHFTSKKGGKGR